MSLLNIRSISILLCLMFCLTQNTPQIISYHPETSLVKQFSKEVNSMLISSKFPIISFPDKVNYTDSRFGNSSLNLTQVSIGVGEIINELTVSLCQDNTIKLIGGKNSGYFLFKALLNITQEGVAYASEIIFSLNGTNLLLSKQFGISKGDPQVSATIHIDLILNNYNFNNTNTTDMSIVKDIIESGLNTYIGETVFPFINDCLQTDLNTYYTTKYKNNLKLNLTTEITERRYILDLNYVDTPQTEIDPRTQKCGILFKRSGELSGVNTTQPAVDFTPDYTKNKTQVFISRSVFDNLIASSTEDYALRGRLTGKTAEYLGLPFYMTVKHFAKVLPEILNEYSGAEEVEAHWTVYDIDLNYEEQNSKVSGFATLDSTFYVGINTPHAKQIYSFSAVLKFDVNIFDSINKLLNFDVDNFEVLKIKVREHYGMSNVRTLKTWIKESFTDSIKTFDFSFLKDSLDLSIFYDESPSIKIFNNGILLY